MRQPRFLTSSMKVTAGPMLLSDRGLGDVEAQAPPNGRILDQGQHEFQKIALAERLRGEIDRQQRHFAPRGKALTQPSRRLAPRPSDRWHRRYCGVRPPE